MHRDCRWSGASDSTRDAFIHGRMYFQLDGLPHPRGFELAHTFRCLLGLDGDHLGLVFVVANEAAVLTDLLVPHLVELRGDLFSVD